MIVYLFSAMFSLFFAYLSQKCATHGRVLLKSTLTCSPYIDGSRSHDNGCLNFFLNKKVLLERFFTFLSFFSLFIISAIRYLVGTDYDGTYKEIYDYIYINGYQFNLAGETLYALLNRMASIYSGADYVGVFALSSLLICGFTFVGLKKQSTNFVYSVLLFIVSGYYFWSFNAIRQMLVMSIFIYAFQYILKSQPWKYFVCIFFATGFHTMALLYLPIYFLKKIKMNFKFIFILSVVFVSSASLFRYLAYFFVSKIEIFNIYVIRYFDSFQFYQYTESSPVHAFINLIFLILFLIIAKIYDKCQEKSSIWIMLQFLAFAFASFSSELPLANRISRLFAVTQILSIPYMINLIENKSLKIMMNFMIIICWTVYSAITFYVLKYHNVFPYQTIFDR